MAITQKQFDLLVEKLEEFSKRYPKTYRLRVALFAVLGYTYIFLVIAGLLLLICLMILAIIHSPRINAATLQFTFLLLILLWIVVRSLWVTFSPPQGVEVNSHQAPHLFALIDELTTKLKAPKFHKILLNQDFNAAVVQIPRLGILGWQKNYLIVGIPLIQSLSLEQFKAVLAHELGHLSGNHSCFAAWIYRLRKTWLQIYERLHQGDKGSSILFNRFLKWYWPAFNAYSFTLARLNEYEADHCSAQLVGAHNTAEALISIEVKARFLESVFWTGIQKQVEYQADPPGNTYSSMLSALYSSMAEEQSYQWLQQALLETTNNADTHPCLVDRLKSLGYSTPSSQNLLQSITVQASAAEQLLGDTLRQLAKQFDRDWQEATSTSWRQRYAYLQDAKGQLQALEQKAQKQPLIEKELWEQAYYTLELQGGQAALSLLQDLLTKYPNHAEANYALGQALLSKADATGIQYIEKAIAQRTGWVIEGCDLIYRFFWQQGQTETAQHYRERADHHYQLLRKARAERASVSDRDQLKSHTLTASEVNELKEQVAAYPKIKEAYLVEKIVTCFPEDRLCLLGVSCQWGFFEGQNAAPKMTDLLATSLKFPVPTYVIILDTGSAAKFKKKICKIDQSLIFRR